MVTSSRVSSSVLPRYQTLRVVAASATGVAAVGWLGARLGFPNPVATVADGIGAWSVPAVLTLWVAAVLFTLGPRPGLRSSTRLEPADEGGGVGGGVLVPSRREHLISS